MSLAEESCASPGGISFNFLPCHGFFLAAGSAWMAPADLFPYSEFKSKFYHPQKKIRGLAEAIWEIEEDPGLKTSSPVQPASKKGGKKGGRRKVGETNGGHKEKERKGEGGGGKEDGRKGGEVGGGRGGEEGQTAMRTETPVSLTQCMMVVSKVWERD